MGEILEVLERRWYRRLIRWPWFSWEIEADSVEIKYTFWAPNELIGDEIRRKILGKHPDMEISKMSDTDFDFSQSTFVAASSMRLARDYPVPIKSYYNEVIDSQAAIVTALSDLAIGEKCVIQVMIQPAKRYQRGFDKAAKIVKGWDPDNEYEKIELFEGNIHGKQTKQLAHCTIRIMAGGKDKYTANRIRSEVSRSFGQFKSEALNSFVPREKWTHIKPLLLNQIKRRVFPIAERKYRRMILNIEELSGIVRLPSEKVNNSRLTRLWLKNLEVPPGVIAMSKEARNLPANNRYVHIGTNTYRMKETPVMLDLQTLRQHMGIYGGAGVGKTTFIINFLLDLCRLKAKGNPVGFFLICPFGELAQTVLSNIPEELLSQVNYVQPNPRAKEHYPFNVFDIDFPSSVHTMTKNIGTAVGRIWPEGWGPRPERNFLILGAALERIGEANIVNLERVLRDWKYAFYVLERIRNEDDLIELGVVDFLSRLVAGGAPGAKAADQRYKTEITDSTLNKLIHFTMSDLLGGSMGAKTSGIRWLESMNKGMINILDLGLVDSDDEKKMIGSLALTLNYQAAITRSSIDETTLYPIVVDEMPMFLDANEEVINEMADRTRQKNVPIVGAAQGMISQLKEPVADAIGRNFVTHVMFRMNHQEDCEWMATQFNDPNLTASHIKQTPSNYAYARIGLGREPSRPFTLLSNTPNYEKADPQKVEQAVRRSLDTAKLREKEKGKVEIQIEEVDIQVFRERFKDISGMLPPALENENTEGQPEAILTEKPVEDLVIEERLGAADDSYDDDYEEQDTVVVASNNQGSPEQVEAAFKKAYQAWDKKEPVRPDVEDIFAAPPAEVAGSVVPPEEEKNEQPPVSQQAPKPEVDDEDEYKIDFKAFGK